MAIGLAGGFIKPLGSTSIHLVQTDGRDEPFRREVRQIAIPDTLAVMIGQGIRPRHYDALVDRVPSDVLIRNMGLLRQAFAQAATKLVHPAPSAD